MIKKLLASTLISVFLFFNLFVSFAHAQTWYSQSPVEWYSKVFDQNVSPPNEIFGERYTAAQVQWVIYGLGAFFLNAATQGNTDVVACFISAIGSGSVTSSCVTAVTNWINSFISVNTDAPSNLAQRQGFLAIVFKDRPISAVSYFREKLQNLSLIPTAQAQQGFGFSRLNPIQGLWRAFRNIAYGLAIIVTLALAFMIMFRIKTSPQTVITAQSALPKIAMALVLITFSYAIAGLLIDLVYVLLGLIAALFAQANLVPNWQYGFGFLTGEFTGTGIGVPGGIFTYLSVYLVWFATALFASLVAATGGIYSPVAVVFSFLAWIAFIVLLVVFLIAAFKVVFMLVKALATIYLLVIFAPIQLLVGTIIPSFGFGTWIRSLVANLLVFPLTAILFLIAFVFVSYSILLSIGQIISSSLITIFINMILNRFGINIPAINAGDGWAPPLLGGEAFVPLIFALVSLIIVLMIPKIADIIKGFASGRPFDYGSAIGEAFGPASAAAGFAVGSVQRVGGGISSEFVASKLEGTRLGKYLPRRGGYDAPLSGKRER